MSNKWLEMIEAHVEKGILALSGVFLVGMLVQYFILTPHRIDFEGRKCSPRELNQAITEAAQELEGRMRSATADDPKIAKFGDRLKQEHNEGIFAAAGGAPVLPVALRRTAFLGGKIEVPGLEDFEKAAGSVTLVSPLPPSTPRVRTGVSVVYRQPLELSVGPSPAAGVPAAAPQEPTSKEAAAEEDKPLSWISVAAYFDTKKQNKAMLDAQYALHRSKAYFAGAEAERQELLAGGLWSEWKPVESKAMPKLDIRAPKFEDGRYVNRDEVEQTFALLKQWQVALAQPPFYAVESGDDWKIPPIEGFEDKPAEEDVVAKPKKPKEPPKPPTPVRQPGGRFGGEGGGRLGGEGGGRFGGEGGPPIGGGEGAGPAAPAVPAEADPKVAARKEIRESFNEIKKFVRDNEWQKAHELALRIRDHQHATPGEEKKAKGLVEALEKKMKKSPGAGQFAAATLGPPPRTSLIPAELVTRPDSANETAVWFHDDTVEPGKTYRYRLRVKLWNRYVAHTRALKKPEDARLAVIAGEWSEPSAAVTAAAPTNFFVVGPKTGTSQASVEVFRFFKGEWLKKGFEVGVGDRVGDKVKEFPTPDFDDDLKPKKQDVDFSTDAVVLDIRAEEKVRMRATGRGETFRYDERPSMLVIYLDPVDGQVKERVQAYDRQEAKRYEEES